MNLRSVRTFLVSISLGFALTWLPGFTLAQDQPTAAANLVIPSSAIVTDSTYTANVTYFNLLGGAANNWLWTAVYVDGVFEQCFNNNDVTGNGQHNQSIPIQIPLNLSPGTYNIQVVTEPINDSNCTASQIYYATLGQLAGCGTGDGGGCPGDDLIVLDTGSFTVTKTWVPNHNSRTINFDYSCTNGQSGSGVSSTEAEAVIDITWDVDNDDPVPPTCDITENVASNSAKLNGYTELNGDGECTGLALVSDDNVDCDFVNDVDEVPFLVYKDFSDDNPAEVDIELVSCTNQTVLTQTVKGTASDEDAAGTPAEFTVDNFRHNGSSTCTFREVDPGIEGYTPGICQGNISRVTGGSCTLVNTQDPVEVYVDKVYSEAHPNDADPEVDITLTCNGDTTNVNGNPNSNTATTVDGRATFVVTTFPFDGAECFATEVVPAGYVQDTSDDSCGIDAGTPGFLVVPGGTQVYVPDAPAGLEPPPPPATCTITNRPTEATFTVDKQFSDGNTEASTTAEVSCSDDGNGPGLIFNTHPNAASGIIKQNTDYVATVKWFSAEAVCSATEIDMVGYTEDLDQSTCDTDTSITDETDGSCIIFNDQDPIEIEASKVYSHGGGPAANFEFACTNLDTGGTALPANLAVSAGVPGVFTVNDIMWNGTTICSVTEPVPPPGYYVSDNTCDDMAMYPNSDFPRTCQITNSPTRATFEVTKYFDDLNNVDEIEAHIDCNTGLILDQDKLLSHGETVTFIVTDFTEGSLTCTITEDGEAGYSGVYTNHSITGNPVVSNESCYYAADEIVGDSEHVCSITNYPDPVEISIYKDWVFQGNSAPDINTYIEITVSCNSEIVDKSCGLLGPASDSPTDPESPAGGNHRAKCKGPTGLNDFGMSVLVIPKFPASNCEVTETVHDQAIEKDNGCGEFQVSVNNGHSCVITNTVFFEGIPTLSQYGMAILALLMLGVGFVSFRRFG